MALVNMLQEYNRILTVKNHMPLAIKGWVLRGLIALLSFLGTTGSGHAYLIVTQNMEEMSDPNIERIQQLMDQLIDHNPDVIFLQEAERGTLQAIKAASAVSYQAIFQGGGTRPSGSLVALIKRTLVTGPSNYVRLVSDMDRGLLVTSGSLCGKPITLVNLHLESLDPLFWRVWELRRRQIEKLKKLLAKNDSSFIVAGDFNLVFDYDAEKLFPADWLDAWTLVNPGNPGLTWDPSTNPRAWRNGGFILPGYRLDRMLLKSDRLTPAFVSKIEDDGQKALSDHFGVAADIRCKGIN